LFLPGLTLEGSEVASAVGTVPSIVSGLGAGVGALMSAAGVFVYFRRDCA
jgi:hypothetical protein